MKDLTIPVAPASRECSLWHPHQIITITLIFRKGWATFKNPKRIILVTLASRKCYFSIIMTPERTKFGKAFRWTNANRDGIIRAWYSNTSIPSKECRPEYTKSHQTSSHSCQRAIRLASVHADNLNWITCGSQWRQYKSRFGRDKTCTPLYTICIQATRARYTDS